jgi:hypothetical protein
MKMANFYYFLTCVVDSAMKQTHRFCTPLASCSTDTVLALFVHVALILRCPGTDQRSEHEQQVDYLHVS